VLATATQLRERLKDFRVKIDDSEKRPGWKFAEQEMRGIPLRVEIGPKDIAAEKCLICRRDNGEKLECALSNIEETVADLLTKIQQDMFDRALEHQQANTFIAREKEEFFKHFHEKGGFVKAMWCGNRACEDAIKEELAVTARCIPFTQEQLAESCIYCGEKAQKMVCWGKAY
jgi:prolyl-tRNA synthetase